MTEAKEPWVDPDDAPPFTKEVAARAEIAVGGKVIRPATGTYTKDFEQKSED